MNLKHLKQARENAGYTQIEAANKLGISDSTLKHYEQGSREPKNQMIIDMAQLYHVSTDFLLGNTTQYDALIMLQNALNLSAEELLIIQAYLTLPADSRQMLIQMLEQIVAKKQALSDVVKETYVCGDIEDEEKNATSDVG